MKIARKLVPPVLDEQAHRRNLAKLVSLATPATPAQRAVTTTLAANKVAAASGRKGK